MINPTPVLNPEKRFENYLDNLPYLFVGFEPAPERSSWKENSPYHKISHQSAGIRCHQHSLEGLLFEFDNNLYSELNKAFYDSNIGSPPTLGSAISYSKILNKCNLSCECSYYDLEEGFYPIDSNCLIDLIGISSFDFIEKYLDTNPHKIFGGITSFWAEQSLQVVILGQNSD